MKVTIFEKGEGFVMAKFEAVDNIEHLILETCSMGAAECNVQLGREYAFNKEQQVTFGSFRMPVHSILKDKQPGNPGDATTAAQNAAQGPPYIHPVPKTTK